jgi:transcription initiation factor TFIIB
VRKRQRDVAEASGITDVTIRNRYKEIISKMNVVIDV